MSNRELWSVLAAVFLPWACAALLVWVFFA
jgi:hypothetical protein